MPIFSRALPAVTLALCVLCSSQALAFEWPGRVDRLARELQRGDIDARKAAARQLGSYPASLSETALLAALEDDDVGVRIEAAEAAGRAGVQKAAPILTDWLHSTDVATRRAAVVGLGQLRDAHALNDLVRALGDASKEVRDAAVIALQSLGSPEGVAPLLGRLTDTDIGVRSHAIDALGALKDGRAVVPLLSQLLDPSADLASHAASALGAIGDARAVPTLIQALQGRPPEVRMAAASALGRLRAVSAVAALEAVASEIEPRLSRAGISALARIDDGAARTALIGELGSASHGDAASAALVEQAQLLAARTAVDPERAALELSRLIEALVTQATPATQTTAPTAQPAVLAAGKTLARIGAVTPLDAVVETLAIRVRTAPTDLALALLDALATSDVEAARLALLERLSGAPDDQRSRVIDALAVQLGRGEPDGRAADPLLERLAHAAMGEQQRLIRLLGLTGATRAAGAIEGFLSATDPALRAVAAQALGKIGARAQAPQVLTLLDDKSPDVRLQAAIALREIGDTQSALGLLDRLDPRASAPQAATQSAKLSTTPSDRHALLIALGGVLRSLQQHKTLPSETAERAFVLLTSLTHSADAAIADRALEALATWGPKEALSFLGLGLRTPSSRQRAVITAALGRLPSDESRVALRYVIDQGGERSAMAAMHALGELGDQRDLDALLRVARRRHWPQPAVAAYAIARLTLRGALKPHLAKRALCELGRFREPYVRANVAAALAGIGAGPCEDGGPDPIHWLASATAPAIRVAAARWLHAARAADRIDAALAVAALEECARVDADAGVRNACMFAPRSSASSERSVAAPKSALIARVVEDADKVLADRLVALRMASGAVFIGYSDHNGTVYLPDAPAGSTTLEDPTSATLEPRD